MSWWVYFALAGAVRAATWLLGPTWGYVVGGIVGAFLLQYWARRLWHWYEIRKEKKSVRLAEGQARNSSDVNL